MSRRKRTLDKLKDVCGRIEKLLATQNATLADIPLPGEGEPGETPLERLQRFKRILNETLAQMGRGEPRTCEKCHEALPDVELDEMPWADRCRACST